MKTKKMLLIVKTDLETVEVLVRIGETSQGLQVQSWAGFPKSNDLADSLHVAVQKTPVIPHKPTQFWRGALVCHFLNQVALDYGFPVTLLNVDLNPPQFLRVK